jgi:hypothetical protein
MGYAHGTQNAGLAHSIIPFCWVQGRLEFGVTEVLAGSLAGFPEIIRAVHPDRSADFNAYGGLEVVEDVTDGEIIFAYDPERVQPLNAPKPPLGFNLSGCSGGPVLMHGTRNGLHRWFPVGLLIAAPKEAGTGELASLNIVRARRIHCLKPDGTLDKASSGGWLPN